MTCYDIYDEVKDFERKDQMIWHSESLPPHNTENIDLCFTVVMELCVS